MEFKSSAVDPEPLIDPTEWVARYGDLLYGYAQLRVRNADAVADLVQETFLEAWKGRASYAGRSHVGTWLIGILKHKIIDYHRRRSATSLEAEDVADAAEDRHFTRRGFWTRALGRWPDDPSAAMDQAEFRAVFQECLDALPESLATAFVLRELDGLESEDIW